MSKNLKYTRTTTDKIKACGILDLDNMTMHIDSEDIKLSTLLKDFDGIEFEFTGGIKQEMELKLDEENTDDESGEE